MFHHFLFCDCTTATIQSLPTACTLPARETGGTGTEGKGGEGSQSHPISSQEMAHAAKGKAPCAAHHNDSGDSSLGSLLSENPAFFVWIVGNSGERERERNLVAFVKSHHLNLYKTWIYVLGHNCSTAVKERKEKLNEFICI